MIGGTGQLGSDVVRVLGADAAYEVVPLPHDRLEVADPEQVDAVLGGGGFDIVVNCAAFHRVDECEERVDEAFRVNAEGAWRVARACAAAGALCVFVSTDYVFAGDKGGPYTEDDRPEPVNVYGVSKVAGELLVRQACTRSLVLRISSVFGQAGARGKGGNFIEAILGKARAGGPVRVVNDQWMSPTYTRDAAEALAGLLRAGATGVYHACNAGRCTWWEFAREAVRQVGLPVEVEPITADAFPSKARRPRDSSMRSLRLADAIGRPSRPWQEALAAYLIEKGHVSRAAAATGGGG